MRQFCFLYFHHRHSSLLSLPWKHNKRSKPVSQPKLTKISSLMLMTYQSPFLISPKKKTGWEKIIKARPCATSLDWSRDPDAPSIYGSVRLIICWISRTLKLQGRWGPWSFRGVHLSTALFPTSREPAPPTTQKSPISCAWEEDISPAFINISNLRHYN